MESITRYEVKDKVISTSTMDVELAGVSYDDENGVRVMRDHNVADAKAPLKTAQGDHYRIHEDGMGYDVLHPTKGWKRVSRNRVFAQQRLHMMLNTRQGVLEKKTLMQRMSEAMRSGLFNENQDALVSTGEEAVE